MDEETREELAKVRANQTYMIKLLETLVDLIPPKGKRPNIKNLIAPLANNPMVKNNPQLSAMVGQMVENIGGYEDEH